MSQESRVATKDARCIHKNNKITSRNNASSNTEQIEINESDKEESSKNARNSNQNHSSSNASKSNQSYANNEYKIEMHINPNNMKYHKIYKPYYPQSVDIKCDSYMRNSTRSTDIKIKTF